MFNCQKSLLARNDSGAGISRVEGCLDRAGVLADSRWILTSFEFD
jgi:hypothetical protein